MLFGAAMLQRFGWLKVVQLVESAVFLCLRTAPHRPPWTI